MATTYYVVLREGPSNSSDAAVGTKPTEKSKILEPALDAQLVKLEAENVAEAQTAARQVYGSDTTPMVVVATELKES